MSGFGTTTWRSNRPGLNKAGSKTSGRFVAATKITPSFVSNHPFQLKVLYFSLHRTCRPAPLCLPIASISSINIIQGEFFPLFKHISYPRRSNTNKHFNKIEPEIVKKGHLSPNSFASNVFPVPGGPTSKTPLNFPPSFGILLDLSKILQLLLTLL